MNEIHWLKFKIPKKIFSNEARIPDLVSLVRLSQNELSEILINPKINKEVCKVVDVDDEVQVSRQDVFVEGNQDDRDETHESQEKQACSDLHRLHVTRSHIPELKYTKNNS